MQLGLKALDIVSYKAKISTVTQAVHAASIYNLQMHRESIELKSEVDALIQ